MTKTQIAILVASAAWITGTLTGGFIAMNLNLDSIARSLEVLAAHKN